MNFYPKVGFGWSISKVASNLIVNRVKYNGNLVHTELEFCYATLNLVSLWNGNGRRGVYNYRISTTSNVHAIIIITKALKLYTSFFLQIVCVFFWLKIQKLHIYFDILHGLVTFFMKFIKKWQHFEQYIHNI